MSAKPPHGGRPTIRVRAGQLHNLATEGENALVAASTPFYVRGGSLVRPVSEELPAAGGRKTTVHRLVRVDTDAVVDHLSRAASWKRSAQGRWVPTD